MYFILQNSKISFWIITTLLSFSFDSSKAQSRLSNMSRGAQSHSFEKILKSLLIASSIPKNNPET